jgi:hypothetical protein
MGFVRRLVVGYDEARKAAPAFATMGANSSLPVAAKPYLPLLQYWVVADDPQGKQERPVYFRKGKET